MVQAECHPWYDSFSFNNDICLLRLSAPVTFTDYVSPVCLAAANSTAFSGTNVWLTGWGKADNGEGKGLVRPPDTPPDA